MTRSRPRQSQFDQFDGEHSSPVSVPVDDPPAGGGVDAAAQ
ncbi:MAG: hypothetical protein U0326_26425 [Polyangiales bacterium]